jgi:hypothetical protein
MGAPHGQQLTVATFVTGLLAVGYSLFAIGLPLSHLQNSMEIAGSVRARLQSCRKTIKNIPGFSPCVYLFSFVCDYAVAKAGK